MIIEDILTGMNESTLYSMKTLLEVVMMDKTVIYMPSFFGWNNSKKEGFRIILMERGGIIEDGSHEELMSRKGIYFNLSTVCNP
jgi:ABC-type transport system involved in cytochrome bd biosynthesis fused ATPase/permease subunit